MRPHSVVGLITNSSSEAFCFRRDFDYEKALRAAYAAYVLECKDFDPISAFLSERTPQPSYSEGYTRTDWPPKPGNEQPDDKMELDAGDHGELDYEFKYWLKNNYSRFGFTYFGRID